MLRTQSIVQVAWDEVEELSAAAAHKKVAFKDNPVNTDPLEAFCDENPDADECRVYVSTVLALGLGCRFVPADFLGVSVAMYSIQLSQRDVYASPR